MTAHVHIEGCNVFAEWGCKVEDLSTWQSHQSSEKSTIIKELREKYEHLASEVAKKSHESKQYTLKIERSYSSASVEELRRKVEHLRYIVNGLHASVHNHYTRTNIAKAAQEELWKSVTKLSSQFFNSQSKTYRQLVSYTSEEVTVTCGASNGLCKLCVPFPSMTSLLHGIGSNVISIPRGEEESRTPEKKRNLALQKTTRQSTERSADHASQFAVDNAPNTYSQTRQEDKLPWFMVYVSAKLKEFHIRLPKSQPSVQQSMPDDASRDVEVGWMYGDQHSPKPDTSYSRIGVLAPGSDKLQLTFIAEKPVQCPWVVFKSKKPNLKIELIELYE